MISPVLPYFWQVRHLTLSPVSVFQWMAAIPSAAEAEAPMFNREPMLMPVDINAQ